MELPEFAKRWKYRVREVLLRRGVDLAFDRYAREQVGRRDFFANAFRALTFNGIDGDYVEFGCHFGGSFALAYHEAKRYGHRARLWAFDSFAGLPEPESTADAHPEWVKGRLHATEAQFRASCTRSRIPEDAYSVVPGFFADTLPALATGDRPSNIALAYIDCDLYSSTKTVLTFLRPRLKHGMIVAFDDYFCWSATEVAGERRAMLEWIAACAEWDFVPYRGIGWHGQSFVVESREIAGRAPGVLTPN